MATPNRRTPGWRSLAVSKLLGIVVLPLGVATIVGVVVLWPDGSTDVPASLGPEVQLVNGTVIRVERVPCPGETAAAFAGACHRGTARLTSGPDRGTEAALELLEGRGQPAVRPGDGVVLGRTIDAEGVTYYFSDYQRHVPLLWLVLLFVVVVVGIGRLRGLTALVGVGVTFGLLLHFMLPAILEGRSPLLVAIVGSAASMFVILYMAHGVSVKTTAALLGTLVSLTLTGMLAAIFVSAARLLNLGSDETAFLQLSAAQVNLQGLLLGGIIIGSLGVLNDVTITQASAVWALRDADPTAGFASLYRSAMRVGRDHIASTVDTLVLAYAGASLPLLLLFTLAGRPVGEVLMGSVVAEEIVRTLVGGIGLAASVPITTALAAVVVTRQGPAAAPGPVEAEPVSAPAPGG